MVAAVDISGITGKYHECCGRLNSDQVRISYRYGRMNSPSKPLPPPRRLLWTDPDFLKA